MWFSRRCSRLTCENSRLTDQLVLTLAENMQGVQVVKGFAREAEEIAKFARGQPRGQGPECTIFRRISLFQPAMGFLTQLNLVVLLGYGGYLVVAGELSLGAGCSCSPTCCSSSPTRSARSPTSPTASRAA